ncbi:hypothetical protein T484DRAFT_1756348 [Baffinella frigidus]|nr:hypothetical protein T484DRAFT_1756348 [Cryptophyta sp. CCMP2293]
MAAPVGGFMHIPDDWSRENHRNKPKQAGVRQQTHPVQPPTSTASKVNANTAVSISTENNAPNTAKKRKRTKAAVVPINAGVVDTIDNVAGATGNAVGTTGNAVGTTGNAVGTTDMVVDTTDNVTTPQTTTSVPEQLPVVAPQTNTSSSQRHCDETESVMRGLYYQVEKLSRRSGCALQEGIYLDSIMTHIPYADVLQQMFGGNAVTNSPCVPVVTRAYEESYMREALTGVESACVMGSNCECQFVDEHNPFIGVQFTLPVDAFSVSDTSAGMVEELSSNRLCVLCCRKNTQSLFYEALYNHRAYNACIQLYGNICDRPVNHDGSFPEIKQKVESGKGDGEGVSPIEDLDQQPSVEKNKKISTDTLNPNGTHSKCSILSDYPEIDDVVLKLYDIFTRDPGVMVQIQIDRYFFAASSRFVAGCGGDMQTCVLHEAQVPSVFNLPDIVYILRQRLIRGSWANAMQETVCRYTIPGMQKSRWVARQRKTATHHGTATGQPRDNTTNATKARYGPTSLGDNTEDPLTAIYINTMLGLLLGLYPRCSKRPGFTMRVRIVRTVRALLTSSASIQAAFILQHVSLVRLAMVEYFANVLELYCPVEYSLLQRHVDVDAYVNLCRSSCDLFRVNNLSEGTQENMQNQPLDWGRLDHLAYKMTDKIIRSTRVETKLVNYIPVHHKSIKKLVSSDIYKTRESCDEFLTLVKGCAVACWHDDHSYLYQRMLVEVSNTEKHTGRSLVESTLDLNLVVSDVHSIVRATMLPMNFIQAQVNTLRRLYKHDTVPLLVASKKRVCLHCLLRIAPKQFVLEEKINGNIRMNLETDSVFCNRCMSDKHMINIDLVGRLLRINQQYMYICIECGATHEWKADGCDLLRCPNQPKERLRLRCELHDDGMEHNKFHNSVTGKCRTHCFVCSKLCTGQGVWLLHAASMRMIHFDLCSTHLPPMHMLRYIIDTGNYQRWLANMSTHNKNSRKKRRL